MYEKFANWKNFPDESTPVTAAALTHIEQGISDADITRDGTPAEVALSSRLSAAAGSAEGLVQAERAAREAALALKADSAEMIDALGLKANASAVYTKAQVDAAVSPKANSVDVYTKNAVYTKGEVESGLSQKPNKTDVYTKAETYSRAETGTQITNAITASRPPLYGTGFPNGKVAAPVGALYADEAVTNGASLWQKVSGTGTLGWQVVRGETGSRNIASLQDPTAADLSGLGYCRISRTNGTVELSARVIPLKPAGTPLIALPPGFAFPSKSVTAIQLTSAGYRSIFMRAAASALSLTPYGSEVDGTPIIIDIRWETVNDWPSPLPGTN